MRKVFLDDLPRKGKFINWSESIRYKVRFIYDDIKGCIEIVNYDGKYLYIKYLNKPIFKIATGSFSKCLLGSLLNKYTKEFKIEIGTHYKDEKRDITIINKKYIKGRGKYYQFKCNKCGFDCGRHYSIKDKEYKNEYWITEGSLKRGNGCACCSNQIVVENINSIYKTDPWMIPYIGEECAKTHTHSSNDKVKVTCSDCKRVKKQKMRIANIYKTHSIGCSCGDGISYPEKFVFNLLEQLGSNFQTQLTKSTYKWCDKYKYDFSFVLNNEMYIVETHGLQHYEDCSRTKAKDVQTNDLIKKSIALENRVKEKNYIIIDCRYSNLEWIRDNKNGVLNSRLAELFNLSKIDWLECEKFTFNNKVKEVYNLKKDNPKMTINDIKNSMRLSDSIIRRYLIKGCNI